MAAPSSDWPTTLRNLKDRLDQTLDAAVQHAAGQVDADRFAQACQALAQAFAAARPATGAAPAARSAEVDRLLGEIATRLNTLGDLQGRLSAGTRQALAQLLPQDALQDYARLGQSARGPRRGGYG